MCGINLLVTEYDKACIILWDFFEAISYESLPVLVILIHPQVDTGILHRYILALSLGDTLCGYH